MPSHAHALSTARNLLLQHEVLRIGRALEEIDHIFVKGVILAETLYPNLGDRDMVDIDLVVHPSDLSAAVNSLEKVGIRRLEPFRALDHPDESREAPLVKSLDGGVEVVLDLHWHLLDPRVFPLAEHDVWRHVITTEMLGALVPTTDATLTALHLAVHHVQHRCTVPHIMSDLQRHVEQNAHVIDWKEFWRLADSCGATHAAAFALQHARAVDTVPSRRARLLCKLVGYSPRAVRGRWDAGGTVLLVALLSPRATLRVLADAVVPPRYVVGTVLGVPTEAIRPHHYIRRLVRRNRSLPDIGPDDD